GNPDQETMMTRIALVLPLAALLLAGCSHAPAPSSAPASAPLASMRALPAEREATPRYKIDISYPLLPDSATHLASALQATGSSARQASIDALPAVDSQTSQPGHQRQSQIRFAA